MNLASQSVLECLNACLDHRGSIFIPELGTTFHVKPRNTRLFACQNPVEEGGGRKALPKSFLNRFTQVIRYFHRESPDAYSIYCIAVSVDLTVIRLIFARFT